MQKIIFFLILMVFVFSMGCSGEKDTSKVPDSKESKDVMASLPEGPLSLPAESDLEAKTHKPLFTSSNDNHYYCQQKLSKFLNMSCSRSANKKLMVCSGPGCKAWDS